MRPGEEAHQPCEGHRVQQRQQIGLEDHIVGGLGVSDRIDFNNEIGGVEY